MSKIYCPYCIHRTDVHDVMYRCLKNDPGCAAPFLADRQNARASCLNCGLPAHRRVCPECQHDLPAGYCSSIPNRIIPVFGALNSGKSTYLAVLIHEMRHRAARELDATFVHLGDQTRNQYASLMARPLFEEGVVLPATTASEGLTPTPPLIHRLTYNGKKAHAVNLVFFDAAGEEMAEEHLRDRYEPYLNAADGVIFIVDPAEFAGARGDLTPTGVPKKTAGVSPGEHTVVQLTEWLKDLRPGSGKKVRVPGCLVLSKIDALPAGLSRNTAISSLPQQTGGLDSDDRAAVHDEVCALLDRWRSDLANVMADQYERSGLFAVSALGAPPRGDRVDPTGVRPHRVTDPLIWLLSEFDDVVRR